MAGDSLRRRLARLEQTAGSSALSEMTTAELEGESAALLAQLPVEDQAALAAFDKGNDLLGVIAYLDEAIRRQHAASGTK